MTAAAAQAIVIVAVGDPRLASFYPERDAWFEDQMDEGPIYIVVTRGASDERLASLARRFDVELHQLLAFRDA